MPDPSAPRRHPAADEENEPRPPPESRCPGLSSQLQHDVRLRPPGADLDRDDVRALVPEE